MKSKRNVFFGLTFLTAVAFVCNLIADLKTEDHNDKGWSNTSTTMLLVWAVVAFFYWGSKED